MGGLGNQLFQLAAGAAISAKTGNQAQFSTTLLEIGYFGGATERKISISDLLNPHELLSRSLPMGFVKDIQMRTYRSANYVLERGPSDDVLTRVNSRTHYVKGYFQDIEIVESAWGELQRRFICSQQFSRLVTQEPVNQIAVHMRYGDYLSNRKARMFHGLTHPEYFVDGINFALETGSPNKVILVSDDPKKALCDLEKFGLSSKVQIQLGDCTNELHDLSELARSSALVISNSSFSWWGALIASKRFNSKVIIPTPWFANLEIGQPNLYLEGWHIIKRRIGHE
jgi:hypothetical protein